MTTALRPVQLRPIVARAWRRASLSGLDPGSLVHVPVSSSVNAESRLMRAARPVLDELENDLSGSRFSLLLADRESRIVDRRMGSNQLGRPLDRVLAVVGSLYAEENTGTNALATTFEVRAPITVSGHEHFLESFKDFSCYGHPIIDPLTGRLEGVLDVTGFARDASPLMAPLLARACLEIQQRLISDGGTFQRNILAAYQRRLGRTHAPLLVFTEKFTLSNRAAAERVPVELQRTLQAACVDLATHLDRVIDVDAGDGTLLQFSIAVIEKSGGAFICEAVGGNRKRNPVPRSSVPVAAALPCQLQPLIGSILVTGESGSGKTLAARRLAADVPTVQTDASLPQAIAELEAHLEIEIGRVAVIVENIHLLTENDARRLGRLMDVSPNLFILTATGDPLVGEKAALETRCPEAETVPGLRSRAAEIPAIARRFLVQDGADWRLSPSAAAALQAQPWTGNFRELHAVLRQARSSARDSTIELADLPKRYRAAPPPRQLGALEQSEFETITRVLAHCAGNKAHAAAELGIGRTTLYRRLRALGIEI